jgi:hypothetical protein
MGEDEAMTERRGCQTELIRAKVLAAIPGIT